MSIDDAGVETLATHLAAAAAEVRASGSWTRPPIRFDDTPEELTYMALASLLDFGSGWDPLLAAKGGRSAGEAVEFAVLGLAMQGDMPDAAKMAEFQRWEVSGCFNLDASEEREVMPGVTMTSPGPLAPFLGTIQRVINETGAALVDAGHASLGDAVAAAADVAGGSAAMFIERLAASVPGFEDRWESEDGRLVVWHRKAQQLAGRLHARFARSDTRFDFSADVARLTLDSGAPMAAVLVGEGVLCLEGDLAAAVAEGSDVGGTEAEVALRAATVEAGRRVCEAMAVAGAEVAPREVSVFLQREAERRGEGGEARAASVAVNRSTVAY